MHKRKLPRHQRAANARWRCDKAQAERVQGIPDREPLTDWRRECVLDLRGAGGTLLRFEPRAGYIGWRQCDEAGQVMGCAAIKTLLHLAADGLPKMLGLRNTQ